MIRLLDQRNGNEKYNIVFFAIIGFSLPIFCQDLNPPFCINRITADYGPREIDPPGTWFHQGLDYNPFAGAPAGQDFSVVNVNTKNMMVLK